MLYIKALANRGPSGEPIATPSVCSYSWPLKVKSWSFVAALEKIDKVQLIEIKMVCFIKPIINESLVGE